MIKPEISKNSNANYLGKIFKLTKLTKAPNSDRLYTTEVDFQPVITNKDAVLNDWYVYFPTESKIIPELLSFTNSYRDSSLNKNPEAIGYFDKNSRVKTVKMRGQYSSGFILPLARLEDFVGSPIEKEEVYFDTISKTLVVEKYIKPFDKKEQVLGRSKADKKASKLNVVDGQFKFHEDTDNLRKSSYKLAPDTNIDVTYKYHGTSAIVGNVLFEKPQKWYEKLLKLPVKKYYDYIWSSRKVIKNRTVDPGFYSQDIWSILKEEIKDKIPKGFILYGEIVGYLPDGGFIQKNFDYGLKKGTYNFYIYRITYINEDGFSVELTTDQVIAFSKKVGLPYIDKFFSGTVREHYLALIEHQPHEEKLLYLESLEMYDYSNSNFEEAEDKDKELCLEAYTEYLKAFQENYVKILEATYNEKDCYICNNKVPEEGIVIRLSDRLDKFEALKLKSFRFLMKESTDADNNVSNIEDEN